MDPDPLNTDFDAYVAWNKDRISRGPGGVPTPSGGPGPSGFTPGGGSGSYGAGRGGYSALSSPSLSSLQNYSRYGYRRRIAPPAATPASTSSVGRIGAGVAPGSNMFDMIRRRLGNPGGGGGGPTPAPELTGPSTTGTDWWNNFPGTDPSGKLDARWGILTGLLPQLIKNGIFDPKGFGPTRDLLRSSALQTGVAARDRARSSLATADMDPAQRAVASFVSDLNSNDSIANMLQASDVQASANAESMLRNLMSAFVLGEGIQNGPSFANSSNTPQLYADIIARFLGSIGGGGGKN